MEHPAVRELEASTSPESLIKGGGLPPKHEGDVAPTSPLLPVSALFHFAGSTSAAAAAAAGNTSIDVNMESAANVSLGAFMSPGPPLAGTSSAANDSFDRTPDRLSFGRKPPDVSADDIAHAFTPLRHYRAAGGSSAAATSSDSASLSGAMRQHHHHHHHHHHRGGSARPREPTPDEVASAITVLRAPALQSLPAEDREEIRRRIAEIKRRRRLSRELQQHPQHDDDCHEEQHRVSS